MLGFFKKTSWPYCCSAPLTQLYVEQVLLPPPGPVVEDGAAHRDAGDHLARVRRERVAGS